MRLEQGLTGGYGLRKKVPIGERRPHVTVAQNGRSAASGWRILGAPALTRDLPRVIRTGIGKEFCGRALLTWVHVRKVTLRLIEPGKPNQNAYIDSFSGRLRDERLHEHWFLNLAHAKAVIEAWRRQYNEERSKTALGGMAPAEYAKYLAERSAVVTTGLNPAATEDGWIRIDLHDAQYLPENLVTPSFLTTR